jgi:hypothetical protein
MIVLHLRLRTAGKIDYPESGKSRAVRIHNCGGQEWHPAKATPQLLTPHPMMLQRQGVVSVWLIPSFFATQTNRLLTG